MTATAVRSKQLVKRYGEVPALGPLDLAIERGQRVSLVGHNGSGKTTLIRLLTGRIDPSDGSAEVVGSDPGSIEARSALSYLADQPVFYDDLSLLEHLEFVARLHGREEWRDRADELLERVGLTDRADDLPITFSRGLKQKAAICIVFIRPFEVLVVDEPFVGLDAHGREALLALFDEAHADGKTLLVATHELTTVKASDRLVALSDGALRYDGSPDVDVTELVDG
jgi:ABC-type multidrug transport system ATPase subunit